MWKGMRGRAGGVRSPAVRGRGRGVLLHGGSPGLAEVRARVIEDGGLPEGHLAVHESHGPSDRHEGGRRGGIEHEGGGLALRLGVLDQCGPEAPEHDGPALVEVHDSTRWVRGSLGGRGADELGVQGGHRGNGRPIVALEDILHPAGLNRGRRYILITGKECSTPLPSCALHDVAVFFV